MSIYTTNRMGHIDTATISVAEGYSANDIGRILYESQVNDQAMFEAILFNDLREINGLREGTLLESEIEALTEGSVKDFFKAVKDRLAKFWSKVKAVFRSVCDKIALFVMGDGKKFIKTFDAKYKTGSVTGTITSEARFFNIKKLNDYFDTPKIEDIKKNIEKDKNSIPNKAEIISTTLSKSLKGGITVSNAKEYNEKVKELVFKPEPLNADNVDKLIPDLKANIGEGKDTIKQLKKTEKEIEKGIKNAGNEIKKAEKNVLTQDSTRDQKKDVSAVIRNISNLVSIYENTTSIIMGAQIKCVKTNIKNSYKYLNMILKAGSVSESSMLFIEADADAEADAVVDVAMSADETAVDQETKEVMDEIIDNAEAEIDEE